MKRGILVVVMVMLILTMLLGCSTKAPVPTTSPKGPESYYNGPLFDTHLHLNNILQLGSTKTLLSYLDRGKVDWAIGFYPFRLNSSSTTIIRSIESRVVTLLSREQAISGQLSETELRQYLQPQGLLWGVGEIGLWRAEFQSITFDSPGIQTVFKVVNESKGIVMIHLSDDYAGGRPTELTEIEPSIRKYPDAIFLFHSIHTFDVVAQLMSEYPNVYYSMDLGGSFFPGKGVSLNPKDAGSNNAESFLAAVNRKGLDYIVERNLEDLAPLLQKYPDRIFWGTDLSLLWNFDESVTDVVIRISRQFIGRLPADVQEKYAYKNALNVFETRTRGRRF